MTKRLSLKDASLFWKMYKGDSVDEDEEDDIFAGYQALSKRRKWTNNPKLSSINDAQNSSPQRKKYSIQINFEDRIENSEAKENVDSVDVIELEHANSTLETRAPLSNLSIKAKAKRHLVNSTYNLNGTSSASQHNLKSSVHNNARSKNSVHRMMFPQNSQNSFTTSLRFQKHSTPKHTALNETLKADDQRMYSALLAEFHRPQKVVNSKTQDKHSTMENWELESSLKPRKSSSFLKSINNAVSSNHVAKKPTYLPVKPWQSSSSIDDDIEIIEEKSTLQVNSLEKKLSQNELVSPQWMLDLKKKYDEKERETRRLLKETQIKKELYAKSNHELYTEALAERIKKHIKITDVVLEDFDDTTKLPELTPEINAKIKSAFKPHPPTEVLVEGFGQLVKRQDIKTLNHTNWLNDEVINFYMNLIVERAKKRKNPLVYAFNTFFYPKLVSQGYNSLRRWTKKVDIFAHDLLLVPIHLKMHWCLAAIDFRDCSVRYYDSMGSQNNKCLDALLKYINEESLDKKKKAYDTSKWKLENVKDIPQQMNGSDCGMFSCMFAEYLSRNAKFTFSQKEMPYFRRKMVYEIISKRLLQ